MQTLIQRKTFSFAALGVFALIAVGFGVHFNFFSRADAACTTTVSTTSAATSAVSSAANGAIICMSPGSYGSVSLTGSHTGDVTFQPDPSADPNGAGKVTFSGISISGNHIVVHNFYSTGGISVGGSSSNDTIDHNNVTNSPGGGGVELYCSSACSGIVINGNKIHDLTGGAGSGSPNCTSYGGDGDAVRLDGWSSVTVSHNEITKVEQLQTSSVCEGHTDCLQSYNFTNSGQTVSPSNITFNNNYEHDNNCQGFFLKDTTTTSAKLTDNLFLRSNNEGLGEANIQIFDTQTVNMDRNTSWSGAGDILRSNSAGYQATLTNSVVQSAITNGCGSCSDGKLPYTITQSNNVTGGNPGFKNTATDDYELVSNPNNVGIDWAPASQQYGPIAGSGGITPPPPPPPPDTTPPTVSMSAPASGATVSGTSNLTANATDNVGVVSVQFKIDGANAGSPDTTSPYSFAWDTTKAANGSHTLTATATDTSGNIATANAVTVMVSNQSADTTAPSTPSGLTAAAPTAATVKLTWNAATDNVGVTSYKIYRNGSVNAMATVTAPAVTFSDSTVSANTTYTYTVTALDAAGNQSAHSVPASVTTPATADTTPPSVPTALSGNATSTTSVALTWNVSTDNSGGSGLAGYHIYRGSALVASPTTNSFTDSGLTAATAYTYSVSAFDNSANGSAASSPITVTTQSNPQFSCAGVSAFICDDFASAATGFTTSGGTWAVSGGTYTLSSPAQATDSTKLLYNQALNTKSVSGDFTMSFDGKTTSTDAFADFGAIFDYKDASNYYYIDYNRSDDPGTNGIFKVVAGTQTKLADFPVTINPSTTYSTKITKTGSVIDVYRGGTLLATATDPTFTAGKVGLGSRNDAASFDSLVVITSPADTQAPTAPSGLAVTTPSSSQANLTWNASTDNVGVSGYRIYRNGASTPVATTTSASYGDSGLAASTSYTYTVSAIDAAGNESAKSTTVTVTTPGSAQTVTLSGTVTDSSSAKAIQGANVHTGTHGTKNGAAQATTNASGQYILSGITPGGHSYNYSATNYKSQGFSLKFPAGSFIKNVSLVHK